MPIIRQATWFTVADCRAHPSRLYVFGDNLAGVGKGGQAIIRNEPNAIGVPTKRDPEREAHSYLTDADWDNPVLTKAWDVAVKRLALHLDGGGEVVIPADGLGTGRAELATRAPRILAIINDFIAGLETEYGVKA